MKDLVIKSREINGAQILDMSGDISSFGESALTEAYTRAEAAGPRVILLNFSDIDYINSTGIALIVTILGRAKKTQRQVLAYGMSQYYKKIFEYTRLADYMPILDDERAALSMVNI